MTERAPAPDDLFEQLPIGAFRIGPALDTIRVNRHFARYLGIEPGVLTREQVRALPNLNSLGPQWADAARAVLSTGEPAALQCVLTHNGTQRNISMRLSPERDAQDRIVGVLGITIDISDAQRAEQALHNAERRFEAFMDHLPVCAWVKNEDGRHEFLNKVYAERFGIKDWAGKTDADLWPPDLARHFSNSDREVRESGRSQEYEQEVRAGGSDPQYWWVHKFPFQDAAGRRMTGGVAMDVTERRDLELRLRESEARFQAFLDHSPALAWMKDEQGHYLFMSRSYVEFLGLSADSWRGLTDFDLYSADFAQRCRDQELEVLAQNKSQETIGPSPDVSGRQREWLLVRYPFSDGAGRRFIGGVATDITERRRAEETLRLQSLTDELTGLYNRRGFWLLSDQEYRLACRRRLRCALLLLDLDGLKQLNDRHGHEAGDQALVAAAEALRVSTRNSDIVGRIGGDEFLVFAVDCDDPAALHHRLRAAIDECNEHGTLRGSLAGSIGVVDFIADAAVPFDQLVAQADARMYEVKRGRASA